ncbi:DUF4652 domain-containing protein [Clostridium thermarum]|uniref:DUF4652 domain-containing protein n=1 Tax=Clostridium thermarum TaxID=1716543 RepID=UPI0013D6D34D|nr:DUF4652 domain-containing protein [Clostridium thermarum]
MNCKIFMKKLPELIDNTLIYDMKEAMEKHMSACPECRAAYEAEKSLDEMFANALQFEDIKFNSSRAEIMRSIDKNRYGKGPLKKMKYSMRKFRWQIVSTAAILVIGIVSAPLIMDFNSQRDNADQYMTEYARVGSVQESSEAPSMKEADRVQNDFSNVKMGITASLNNPESYDATEKVNQVYMPVFEKIAINKIEEPKLATAWKKSPDGSLDITISGKGENASEEGIADLVVYRKQDSALWKLSLANNEVKQFTPMFVEWFDNENVLTVVGYGYGTVTAGGDLIFLNVNTGTAFNVYPENSMDYKNQVVNVVKTDDTLELTLRLYEDDSMTSYKMEKRIFNYKEDETNGLILTEVSRIPQN